MADEDNKPADETAIAAGAAPAPAAEPVVEGAAQPAPAQETAPADGQQEQPPAQEPAQESLLGSSTIPALVDVGAADPAQLGDIVAAAHTASGLSVQDWNALPDADRDALLNHEVAQRKAANAPAPAAAEEPPAPAPAEEANPTNDDLREEIRASLAAHLTDIDKRIDAFIEGQLQPLKDELSDLGNALTKLEDAVKAATPEGTADLLADVQQTLADAKKVVADVQPFLERFPKLEASIKHFL